MRPGYAYTEMCQQALKAAHPQAQLCFPTVRRSLLSQPDMLLHALVVVSFHLWFQASYSSQFGILSTVPGLLLNMLLHDCPSCPMYLSLGLSLDDLPPIVKQPLAAQVSDEGQVALQ